MHKLFLLSILSLFFTTVLNGAEKVNLLQNPELIQSEKGEIPGWIFVRGKIKKTAECVELSAAEPGKGVLIFQRLKNVQPETDYLFEYDFASPDNSRARGYCEEQRTNAQGKRVYKPFSPGSTYASVQWKHVIIPVRLVAGWNEFYAAFMGSGNGTLQIRNISFHLAPKQPGIMGGTWNVQAPHKLAKDGLSAEINGKATAGIRIVDIPVRPGKEYRINYTVQGISPTGNQVAGMHVYSTKILPELPGSVQHQDLMEYGTQKKYHKFVVPEHSPVRKISFSITLSTPGKIRFSAPEISERPIDKSADWRIELDHPYSRGVYTPGNDKVCGRVIGSAEVAKVEVDLDGTQCQRVVLTGNEGNFSLKLPEKKGKYLLNARFYNKHGQCTLRTMELLRVSSSDNAVFSPDGKTLCSSGKKYFSIGIMSFGGDKKFDERQLAQIAAHGVNTLWVTVWEERRRPEVYADMLKDAWKYKIRLFMGCGAPRTVEQIEKFRATVKRIYTEEVVSHPAFAGVFLIDEPLWSGVPLEPLREAYRILREHIPHHPVIINSAPRYDIADLRPYSDACDMFGVDIYPIPYPNTHSGLEDKMPSCVGKYAQRLREIVRNRKPVYILLQGCSWSEMGNKGETFLPYPSVDELRYMALDALTNGADGCMFWGITGIRNVSYMNRVLSILKEIHSLSRLFIEGTIDKEIVQNGIRIVPIRHDKNLYFIALNPNNRELVCQWSVPGKPSQLEFYLEKKVRNTENGVVELKLNRYCATVFGAKKLPTAAPLPSAVKGTDPFEADCKARYLHYNRPVYDGNANWIWDAVKMQRGASCRVAFEFTVKNTAVPALLQVAADDCATVYVNGFQVGKTEDFNKMREYNLRKYLRHGSNLLVIEGKDKGVLPCGILAELRIDGKIIVSDSSWRVLPVDTPVPAKVPEQYSELPAVKVVAPYGAAPWLRQTKMILKE